MIYYTAVIAIQIMTIVHIVRTGRTMPWLYVALFLPLVGSVAYLVAEVLPEFLGGRTTGSVVNTVQDKLDPDRRLRALTAEAERVDTPQAQISVAQELERLNRFAEAAQHYRRAMRGLFENDFDLHMALTEALFQGAELGQVLWPEAATALERLSAIAPDRQAAEQALLRARLAQANGDSALAAREFETLMQGHASPETRVRYAYFLYTEKKLDAARGVLTGVLEEFQRAPAHVRRLNATWYQQAKAAMETLNRS